MATTIVSSVEDGWLITIVSSVEGAILNHLLLCGQIVLFVSVVEWKNIYNILSNFSIG